MMLTKEDYMHLPKERLAELLVELNRPIIHLPDAPAIPVVPEITRWSFGCDGIHCTNPQMDCINCPKKITGATITSLNTATGTSMLKAEGKK